MAWKRARPVPDAAGRALSRPVAGPGLPARTPGLTLRQIRPRATPSVPGPCPKGPGSAALASRACGLAGTRPGHQAGTLSWPFDWGRSEAALAAIQAGRAAPIEPVLPDLEVDGRRLPFRPSDPGTSAPP
ncbi:hypothetical protein VQ03_01355 [Methylobacterium tarhaniae]|uniref:Uncharacterized protein n=1 Tax=Methylobacterium tarhaniae TaxID=1187852 RepID=A0A0J6TFU3_9HYPH|nr:hypothetical protein [Methylobacterium tarhaniae]KMO44802.1 hypothetical protein VQ03_01355 [Methylobacterium tarhaniae]